MSASFATNDFYRTLCKTKFSIKSVTVYTVTEKVVKLYNDFCRNTKDEILSNLTSNNVTFTKLEKIINLKIFYV